MGPEEVSDEVQGAMGLKMVENVRKLIREELVLALQDPTVVSVGMLNLLSDTIGATLLHSSWFIDGVARKMASRLSTGN